MKMLSLDDAIKAVTMLLDVETDTDKVWSCDVINNLQYAPSVTDVEPTQKWISVNDKLPEINEPILFTGKNTIGNRYPAQKGYFSGDEWYAFGLIDKSSDGVTHWMPLPEPPKEDM